MADSQPSADTAPGGATISVEPLTPGDRSRWEQLFRAYMDFYGRTPAPEMYDRAWSRFMADADMHALGARTGGDLVAIAHFLFHANTAGDDVCYLQDLFTAPEARGRGAARALIAAIAGRARAAGAGRLYWTTHQDNATARRLYDRVATHRGFIRYELDLPPR